VLKLKAQFVSADGGGDPVPSMLVNLNQRLQDWREFWATIFIPQYAERIQQHFETEGELDGYGSYGWADLDPAYAEWKTRHFPGTKILERTRRLRDSLAPGSTGPDTVIEAGPTMLQYGTRVPYAKFHEEGTRRMRRRRIFPRITAKEWTPQIRAWVKQQATREGFE